MSPHGFPGLDDFGIPDDLPDDVFRPDELATLRDEERARKAIARLRKKGLNWKTFVWIDIHSVKHKLRDIDDTYLSNIIHYLERTKGHTGMVFTREEVIKFLKDESYRRVSSGHN